MVGSTLDSRYRLERELRADADGVEYAGVDLRLQRPVRVRMLQLGRAADAGYVAAWRDALTRLAGLSHPGILPLYDICLDGEAPYVVEALVDGASLDERLRAGERIGPAQVAAIARQCGRALGAAHAAGLVHGHVSPAAILVDAAGDAFVTGFGLPEGPSVSREQARYLAPEQSVGQPASPRTDIYGLSATLYELLSGRPPFDGPNAVAIGTLKNTADAPPLPEAAAGRALLEAIRSGLSRHPLARPANGSAFAAAVESAAAAAPPPAAALTQTAVLPRTPAARPLGTSPTAGPRPLSPPVPAPRESGGCGGAVIALLLLVGIGAALVYALKHPGGNIPVPALTGKTETEAKKLLTDLKLRADVVDSVFDDNVPSRHVLSQDPPSETKLKPGEGVKLVISKGPRFVTVPSLKGLSERQAKNLLAKSGLSFGGSESTQLDGVAEGVVTAQAPPAETRVEKSTSVQLFVNHPPKPTETAPPEAKPGDAGEPGLVDQALDRLKEKAGEAASQAVEAGKEKLRQGAQDLKERAADELRRQLGTEQPAGGKKPGE